MAVAFPVQSDQGITVEKSTKPSFGKIYYTCKHGKGGCRFFEWANSCTVKWVPSGLPVAFPKSYVEGSPSQCDFDYAMEENAVDNMDVGSIMSNVDEPMLRANVAVMKANETENLNFWLKVCVVMLGILILVVIIK